MYMSVLCACVCAPRPCAWWSEDVRSPGTGVLHSVGFHMDAENCKCMCVCNVCYDKHWLESRRESERSLTGWASVTNAGGTIWILIDSVCLLPEPNGVSNLSPCKSLLKPFSKVQGMVVHAFNSSTQEAKAYSCKFKASLVYKANSRTARALLHREILPQKHINR